MTEDSPPQTQLQTLARRIFLNPEVCPSGPCGAYISTYVRTTSQGQGFSGGFDIYDGDRRVSFWGMYEPDLVNGSQRDAEQDLAALEVIVDTLTELRDVVRSNLTKCQE